MRISNTFAIGGIKAQSAFKRKNQSANNATSPNVKNYPAYYPQNQISFKGNMVQFLVNDDDILREYDPKRLCKDVEEYRSFPYKYADSRRFHDCPDRFLADKLKELVKNGEEKYAATILWYMDLIGPVGRYSYDDCVRPLPKFEKYDPKRHGHLNRLEVLRDYCLYDKYPDLTPPEGFKCKEEAEFEVEKEMARKGVIDPNQIQRESIDAYLQKLKEAKAIEDDKEKVKKKLRIFMKEISNASRAEDSMLPNCIMFVGEDKKRAYTMMEWLEKNVTDTNTYRLAGTYTNCETMFSELLMLLDWAKIDYRSNGKYTIIFAPGLDFLIDSERSNPQMIAAMKDYMSSFIEDFHTTVVFYTTPEGEKKLDSGALQPNRVGLRIEMK